MLDWLFAQPLAVGTPAPEFSLRDEGGNQVTLASLRGKNVVLVFYPADDTSVCTKQLCEFRDNWAQALAKNSVVFGVNPAMPSKHASFRNRYNFPFPLLVDSGQKVGEVYHTRSLVPRRTVYLIGPDGRIRFARRGKPDPNEVLASAVI
jgi:peroxiredoxin Q/BCP